MRDIGVTGVQTCALPISVALVARPELVVLDEPTSALDPLGRADVRDVVLSLRERGVAVVLNRHLIGEVGRGCDRVVGPGRRWGPPSRTLARPPGSREGPPTPRRAGPAARAQ